MLVYSSNQGFDVVTEAFLASRGSMCVQAFLPIDVCRARMGAGMEKKRITARLKRKGAYLPPEDTSSDTSGMDHPPIGADDGQTGGGAMLQRARASIVPRTFQRPAWKHYIRFAALAMILFVDCGMISSGFRMHFVAHKVLTGQMVLKEMLAYILLLVANATVLPSIILTASKVEVNSEAMVCQNLLWKARIPWDAVRSVSAPIWLKFAVIRTERFFQLINKKDMSNFNELIQTIETATGQASQ
jgi:hypothetical protein